MFLDIIGLLGTTVGGKIFGDVGRFLSGKREAEERQKEREFHKDLLFKDGLANYHKNVHGPQDDGTYSPMSYVCAYLVLLFGITYALAVGSLFVWEPISEITTKDPSSNDRVFEFGFGLIKYDFANNRILSMSRAGLGYVMLYPFIFLFSTTITGEREKRQR